MMEPASLTTKPSLRKAATITAIFAALVALFYFARAINDAGASRNGQSQPAAQTSLPFDFAESSELSANTLVVMGLIAVSTFISEDLTCIGVGVMIAQGQIGFSPGAFACFLGIFLGDVLLFLAGRYLGRPALTRAPLKWFLRASDVERSSAWFNRRALAIIATSRFVPGLRLPTYFAAGLLRTNLSRFALYFLLAALAWTPLLVGLSSLAGAQLIESALLQRQALAVKLLIAAAVIFAATKIVRAVSSHRGRRLLVSRWRRFVRWEFWPAWLFYIPVIGYIAFLMLKHRSATLFTAANPAILAGGFIGESKIDILRGLSKSSSQVARAELIDESLRFDSKLERALGFMNEANLKYPVVLKPNAGQRGSGVAVIRSRDELIDYLSRARTDTIIQEYVAGLEFGVFYYRFPGDERGRIFSITEKQFPVVTGDGLRTLEQLILDDSRAISMARFYLRKQQEHLKEVVRRGERIQLVELGTHARGAIFLDGDRVRTCALEQAFDRMARGFDGFYFGRFDVRTASVDQFKDGLGFKVVELNGVTSEATHIYDPNSGLLAAYKVLFAQWRLAFEIGRLNSERGFSSTPILTLIKLTVEYKKSAKFHLS